MSKLLFGFRCYRKFECYSTGMQVVKVHDIVVKALLLTFSQDITFFTDCKDSANMKSENKNDKETHKRASR